ncbi:hypothetical protein CGT92_18045 [Vibrio metoecus]|uniref:Uncharacterized protein n=1 Tax=Vibrio metoecus TaxID=1481663 RepID=A0A0Q0NGI0_VIBMT|nr:hypothetical protein VCJ_000637 [Vibrio metoecus]KQA16129.1 hypothetical protein AAY54_16145 [Vibrio metoecus]KQA24972.1 hypothetical protein AAY53_16835 [Vibrio metoecus]KQA98084.1 hypothetical protein XV91_14715 [Vibrio metoecus]KQB00732.1 hypothetical protein XV92_10735 [Vibrio metoecus]
MVGVYVTYRKVGANEFAHNDALKINYMYFPRGKLIFNLFFLLKSGISSAALCLHRDEIKPQ